MSNLLKDKAAQDYIDLVHSFTMEKQDYLARNKFPVTLDELQDLSHAHIINLTKRVTNLKLYILKKESQQ
jgi:hypothetical protein